MLEVIREYAAERLGASGEEEAIRQRHAEFVCEFAVAIEGRLAGPESQAGLRALGAELGNIRAAMAWCVGGGSVEIGLRMAGALRAFWFMRGLISEGARWIEQLGLDEAQASPPVRAKALTTLGLLVTWQGETQRATVLLRGGLEIYRGLGDASGVADTLRLLGEASIVDSADLPEGQALLEQSLSLYQKLGDSASAGRAVGDLAHIAYLLGESERALQLDREALRLTRQSGDYGRVAHQLNNIGFVLTLQGDQAGAIDCLRESLAFAIDAGDDTHLWNALETLAYLAYRQGAFTGALTILGAANEWREFHALPRPASIERDCDEMIRAARAVLEPDMFAASTQRGAEMSLDQIVEYALDYLGRANPELRGASEDRSWEEGRGRFD
jgi:tetratricopeptide (TPR) repeat protein